MCQQLLQALPAAQLPCGWLKVFQMALVSSECVRNRAATCFKRVPKSLRGAFSMQNGKKSLVSQGKTPPKWISSTLGDFWMNLHATAVRSATCIAIFTPDIRAPQDPLRTLPRTSSAHFRALLPRTCAHFRTLPRTCAHFRALPRTSSAHFRALPRTCAHFRALARTSAHFRALRRTSAHFRALPP